MLAGYAADFGVSGGTMVPSATSKSEYASVRDGCGQSTTRHAIIGGSRGQGPAEMPGAV
jgi:hypothetical protein